MKIILFQSGLVISECWAGGYVELDEYVSSLDNDGYNFVRFG